MNGMIKLKPHRRWILRTMFLMLVLFGSFSAIGQKTKVSGKVVSKSTQEPVAFANVFFKDTKISALTDFDGNYIIETYYASDSLMVSAVGFSTSAKAVRIDETQTINFELETKNFEIDKAVIVADKKAENPAHPIVRNILKNKKINNREKLEAYEYELYNKIEFDLNNLTDEFKDKKIFKPFDFVWDNVDTTDEKEYLPIFMTESLSDFYYRKNPKTEKEIIKATKVSGVKNNSVSQFLGDMYQSVNIYDNNVIVFGKSFVSPLSNMGFTFYRYYLEDSAYIDNKWCYKIKFIPKLKQELTFDGEFWVNDTTYAIKQVEATINESANINFIYGLQVVQEFDEVEDEVWMITKDQLVVDFNIAENSMGFYGRKTTTYKDFVIGKERDDGFYSGLSDVIVKEDANDKNESFWDEARHVELTENEKQIYEMVDSIQNIPQFRTIADIITLFVSGYYVVGKFEFGPYFTTYSFNPIEGNRFRIGGRTSNAFSTRTMIEAYGAYGLRDEKFKYGGGITQMISKNPRMVFYVGGKTDIEQLGLADGAFREDNVLSSFFRRNPANKLTGVIQGTMSLEREWFYGLSNKVIFQYRDIRGLGSLNYLKYVGNDVIKEIENIQTSEVTLYTRFAYKEKFVDGEFERTSLGTKHPTIETTYSYGIPDFLDSDYEYHKFKFRVKDKIRFGPFGYMRASAEVGKIWGSLPYPLLELHQGNETFFFDESAFNTMNFFEFVSDEWVSASATYHFEGFFFNKIPLLRKLKWREVANIKGVIGRFDESNLNEMILPDDIYTLSKPFMEGSIGVENIFKFLRVDALYRLSYLDHPNIVKFGIRAKLQIDF